MGLEQHERKPNPIISCETTSMEKSLFKLILLYLSMLCYIQCKKHLLTITSPEIQMKWCIINNIIFFESPDPDYENAENIRCGVFHTAQKINYRSHLLPVLCISFTL